MSPSETNHPQAAWPVPAGSHWLFADSEVASIDAGPLGIVIRLSAAHIEMPPPDLAPGGLASARLATSGHLNGLSVSLLGATLGPEASDAIGRVAQGRIRIGQDWQTGLPLPFSLDRPIRLELQFANQTLLVLEGTGLRLSLADGARFHESLAC